MCSSYETLLQAYGGRLRMVGADAELIAVADTCCDDGEAHDHAH